MTRLNDGAELEVAQEEDFGISRDSDGELQPVKQRIPGTDKAILCVPVVPSIREEYTDVFDSDDADPDRVAELWNDRIEEGIGSDVDPSTVENEMPYGLIAGINQALKNSSGEQVFLAVREQVNEELAGQVEMARQLSDEGVKDLLSSANDSDSQ